MEKALAVFGFVYSADKMVSLDITSYSGRVDRECLTVGTTAPFELMQNMLSCGLCPTPQPYRKQTQADRQSSPNQAKTGPNSGENIRAGAHDLSLRKGRLPKPWCQGQLSPTRKPYTHPGGTG